ncbi:odorant receptor 4-like [Microplitis mediator]|uniref:odorant receptor 4-like n=1 Tax=Microplitis mediator TaxID=375433 RepID=UPI0025551E54|nr:odorant receptor 4-like [Microplitis mediator]
MSQEKISDYLIYREIVKKLLIVVGLWPYDNPSIFYNFLPYIQIFVNVFLCFGMLGFVQKNFKNIGLVTKGMSIMTSLMSTIIKVVCFIKNRSDAMELHKNLDPHFTEILQDLKLSKFVLKRFSVVKHLSCTFTIIVTISCALRLIIPISIMIKQIKLNIHPVRYPLLFPSVFPWKVTPESYIYEFEFAIESFAVVTLCFITLSVDCLFTFYVYQMIGQLREISYCFKNLTEKSDSQSILRKCISQYQILLKSRDILQRVYGPIVLWIMVTNAVIMCTIAFQVTQMDSVTLGRGLLIFTWISLKILQTFMYAWSGSCLTLEAEECRDSVYACEWYGNKRLMTSIIIILSQRPLILTACNFSVVSVEIFQMVINTTVSYFFLLQTLEPEA